MVKGWDELKVKFLLLLHHLLLIVISMKPKIASP